MFDQDAVQPSDVGAVLRVLAEQAPPSAAAVATLTGLDPTELTGGQQVDLLKALQRQIGWLQAVQAGVVVALDSPAERAGPVDATGLPELVAGPGDPEWTQLEVAAALRLSPGTAAQRIEVARALYRRLPGTRQLLADGRISYWHAVRIADATRPLDAQTTAAVEARVLPGATKQSVGQLRRALDRAVIAAGPAAAHAAHEQAVADRTVTFCPLPDGLAGLWILGPAPDVTAVHTALTALADRPRPPGDTRLAGARRFDSLHEICAGHLAGGNLPTRHGQRPHINVTVAATTLLGLDDLPGELAGYGPITAPVARRIAADGTWRRLLHDPADGHLLDYGRTTYQPPADLRRHVIARDRTCTFPHCTRPAHRCDIDHAVPWDKAGTTDPHNCHPLCRQHHRIKTHGNWQLTRQADRTGTTWTSPAGHTYTTHPPTHGSNPPGPHENGNDLPDTVGGNPPCPASRSWQNFEPCLLP